MQILKKMERVCLQIVYRIRFLECLCAHMFVAWCQMELKRSGSVFFFSLFASTSSYMFIPEFPFRISFGFLFQIANTNESNVIWPKIFSFTYFYFIFVAVLLFGFHFFFLIWLIFIIAEGCDQWFNRKCYRFFSRTVTSPSPRIFR